MPAVIISRKVLAIFFLSDNHLPNSTKTIIRFRLSEYLSLDFH